MTMIFLDNNVTKNNKTTFINGKLKISIGQTNIDKLLILQVIKILKMKNNSYG